MKIKNINRINRKRIYLVQIIFGSKFFSMPYVYRIRNKIYEKCFEISSIKYLGHDVNLYKAHDLKEHSKLRIGANCRISNYVMIDYSGGVWIGDDVSIAPDVKIYSHKHPMRLFNRDNHMAVPAEILIYNGAWIGAASIIMPGVCIGEGATVMAGSVVVDDVKPYTMVSGNPAKEIFSAKGIKINGSKN